MYGRRLINGGEANYFVILKCAIYEKELIFKINIKIEGMAADCSFFP